MKVFNQCDGCRAGMPLKGNTHYHNGRPMMVCEAEAYADAQSIAQISDRHLLELAARAAGIVVIRSRLDDALQRDMLIDLRPEAQPRGWNPLTDDGDAFRLAVKLSLDIYIQRIEAITIVLGPKAHISEEHGIDSYAATRRAIVRAAAEIGRAMKEADHA